jgi:hypothetical protein
LIFLEIVKLVLIISIVDGAMKNIVLLLEMMENQFTPIVKKYNYRGIVIILHVKIFLIVLIVLINHAVVGVKKMNM